MKGKYKIGGKNTMEERKALRALMKSGEPFVIGDVFNPMSALIAQSVGFKVLRI